MQDETFLTLSPIEARRHANFQGQPEEGQLKTLYKERNGIDLDTMEAASVMATPPPQSVTADTDPGSNFNAAGIMLLVASAILVVWGLMFDVGVDIDAGGLYGIPSRVANTDKMAVREMIFGGGLTAMIGGMICLSTAAIVKAIAKTDRRPS